MTEKPRQLQGSEVEYVRLCKCVDQILTNTGYNTVSFSYASHPSYFLNLDSIWYSLMKQTFPRSDEIRQDRVCSEWYGSRQVDVGPDKSLLTVLCTAGWLAKPLVSSH